MRYYLSGRGCFILMQVSAIECLFCNAEVWEQRYRVCMFVFDVLSRFFLTEHRKKVCIKRNRLQFCAASHESIKGVSIR